MKQEIKTFLTNVVTVILALEIKGFFEKGEGSNNLAFTLLKIMLLSVCGICIVNMEDVTRVIIHKIDSTLSESNVNGVLSLTKIIKSTNKNS